MKDLLNLIAACFCGHNREQNEEYEKHLLIHGNFSNNEMDCVTNAIAADFLTVLFETENCDENLKDKFNKLVGTTGWTEKLAVAILSGLINAIEKGIPMGKAATEALGRSMKDALQWAKEHPGIVLCTIIALGILVIMTPWVIEALGFAARGPVARTFAAWWQSRYAGYVPKGSLFSFFQRLGMVWKH